MPSSDAIIIGGGTNGMACAFRLAKAGHKVTLLEASATPGGGAATAEFAPGYKVPALAHLTPALDPRLSAAMDLARHGLGYAETDIATTALSADGQHRRVHTATTDGPDAARWSALTLRLTRYANALAPFRAMTLPRLAGGCNEWGKLAKLAFGLRSMGKPAFRDFLRVILTNAADVAEDELSDDLLRGLFAFDATLGAWAGPRSPNTLILALNRLSLGPMSLPRGGPAALATAMAKALTTAGVTIRTDAPVTAISTENHRATGVTLATGEVLTAPLIVSAIGPRTTFRSLVGPRALDTGFHTAAGQIRARGAAAKLHLALTGTPDFRGADLRTRLVIAPSVNAVEDAFNPGKYGEVPAQPVMEIVIPSAHDHTYAPEGHHVLSAIVQFAPHAPADPDQARSQMLENTLAVLETHAPGIRAMIAHAEMLMPGDIEARFGTDGGNWHGGAELSVEQMLFLRPLAQAAQYETPVPGLWLAGAGSHPGGWITGTPGWNAAGAILKGAA
ncbi:MAG: phytoene desaturase family protein [Gemmobacter sp.]